MKFTKSNGTYKATRKDGQVITISKSDTGQWVSRYDNDDNGDNTFYADTKKELVNDENDLEARI